MSRDDLKNPFPLRVRVVQWCFLAAAVIATLCLAWWQWDRWHDSDGTFQNLGYAIQWPIFGIFFIVAYRKYMEYERDRANGEIAPAAPKVSTPEEATEISADLLPPRPVHRDRETSDVFTDDRRRRARDAGRASDSNDSNRVTRQPSDENRIH